MNEFTYEPAKDLALTRSARWKSVLREPGLISAAARMVTSAAFDIYLLLYHRLKIVGRQHIPLQTPFVLIANHTSHLDAVVLAAAVRWRMRACVYPVAAGDTFFTSTTKSIFASMLLNALPLWRKHVGAHALDDLRDRLHQGACAYIVFPEGTRARDGQTAQFKPGIGMLVAGTPVPVIPCHIDGAHRALPASGSLPRPMPMRLRIGAAHRFAHVAPDRDGWAEVARVMQQAVDALAKHE